MDTSMPHSIPTRPAVALMAAITISAAIIASPAQAAPCGGEFSGWLGTMQREAIAAGVSASTAQSALTGLTPDPKVLSLDRNQRVFRKSFEDFGIPRVQQRLAKARSLMQRHANLLNRIEQQYGVPGAVVVAIWGLETDFGTGTGKQSALRALVTLAHDCRRTERFQNELISALKILDRGDLTLSEMRGAWAGELGQTQFLPSSYLKYAVDFDGNGKRDLIRSVPDVLASTANYLRGYGWQRGGSWQEGSANFNVLKEWNKSSVYQKTISYFATQLAGGE